MDIKPIGIAVEPKMNHINEQKFGLKCVKIFGIYIASAVSNQLLAVK